MKVLVKMLPHLVLAVWLLGTATAPGQGWWDEEEDPIFPPQDEEEEVYNPPNAEDDSASTTDIEEVVIYPLNNDSGHPIFLESVLSTEHGSATFNTEEEKITYSPPKGFSGTDVIEYEIADGRGGRDTAIIRVQVSLSNSEPDPEEPDDPLDDSPDYERPVDLEPVGQADLGSKALASYYFNYYFFYGEPYLAAGFNSYYSGLSAYYKNLESGRLPEAYFSYCCGMAEAFYYWFANYGEIEEALSYYYSYLAYAYFYYYDGHGDTVTADTLFDRLMSYSAETSV